MADFDVANDIEPAVQWDSERSSERGRAEIRAIDRELVADKREQITAGARNQPCAAQ